MHGAGAMGRVAAVRCGGVGDGGLGFGSCNGERTDIAVFLGFYVGDPVCIGIIVDPIAPHGVVGTQRHTKQEEDRRACGKCKQHFAEGQL